MDVRTSLLRKLAFSPASAMGAGGQPPMDPAAMQGGQPPMDPAAMQGGQPPMDPAAMQGAMPPMDPSMGGGMAMAGGQPPVDPATGMPMDPAAMGGQPPVDPATGMPMDPAAMGGVDPMTMPITELTVGDLVGLIGDVVEEVMGLGAKEEAPSEPAGAAGESGKGPGDEVVSRLDQILEVLSAGAGAPAPGMPPEASPAGPAAGAMSPEMGPKMASSNVLSIADRIINRVQGI